MVLKQLQYFVVSVDAGSISKAAELLYTTQPNVSKSIDKLEKELNKKLLERQSNGVHLTESGEEVYHLARKVLIHAEEIKKLSDRQKKEKLSIASMPSRLTAVFFAGFYDQLDAEKKETIHLEFLEGSLEMILNDVTHHHAGLGFLYISDYQKEALRNEMTKRSLEFYKISDARLCLFVGPENPFYYRGKITLEELSTVGFVQNKEDQIPLFDYPGHLKNQGLKENVLRRVMEVNSDHVMMQTLLHTELGNISSQLCSNYDEDSRIHALTIENHAVKASYGYVTRKNTKLSDQEKAFVHYVEQKILEQSQATTQVKKI